MGQLVMAQPFIKVIHLKYGGVDARSGESYSNAKSFTDQDLWAIPAHTLIQRVWCVVDTAVTGTTNFDVGDDDDADGFIDGSLSVTLGTTGAYSLDAKLAGAYMRVETAGGTDAADIYVVPAAKYYKASGKELKLDITTANTAGAMRVIVEGIYMGAQPS